MSKLLFFTDMHLDNWSAFSSITNTGYNSRFWEQVKILEGILAYAEKHDCKIVFGGDLFNRRMLVPTDVLHITYELFASYTSQPIYLLVGNHDMYTWNPECTPLRQYDAMNHMNIITEPTVVYAHPTTNISMVPHGALIPTCPASDTTYDILLTHYGVNEARLGPKDFRMKDDLTVKELKDLGYDLVMLGHIHKPQALAENIIVMGSPMSHSFHEANETKYFYVFDCETKELVKYPTGAPMFLTHDVKTKKELNKIDIKDGNYHRINILTKKISLADLSNYTAPNVVIARSTADGGLEMMELAKRENRSPKDEVDAYYDSVETELKRDVLKKESLKIIGEM